MHDDWRITASCCSPAVGEAMKLFCQGVKSEQRKAQVNITLDNNISMFSLGFGRVNENFGTYVGGFLNSTALALVSLT